jgi:hypothetical protein
VYQPGAFPVGNGHFDRLIQGLSKGEQIALPSKILGRQVPLDFGGQSRIAGPDGGMRNADASYRQTFS